MKIIMLGHKRIPSREGGVEIVVEQLACRMVKRGHDVTVYNRKGHNVAGASYDGFEFCNKYEYRGVKVQTVFTLQNKSLNAIVYSFLATLRACVTKTDVIHFHAEGPCSMIPLAKLFGKKCVATIHGLDWQRAKWGGFATRFLLFGEKMAAKNADEVIVLSSAVQDYFVKTYNRKTVLIPNGIEKPELAEATEIVEKFQLTKDGYLLFLARLVPEKGLHTLLEAYKDSNLTLPLVIAGGGSHASDYEKEIWRLAEEINHDKKCRMEGRSIVRTGFVQGRVLQELYSNALLYVLPSEIEGMPLSLLEAMSFGNLCLTSDIEENIAVTGEYGFSFKNKEADSLRESMEKVVSKAKQLREEDHFSRESIQQYILNRYKWDDVVDRTLELYRELV